MKRARALDRRTIVRGLPLYDSDVPSVRFQLSDSTMDAAPPTALAVLRATTVSAACQYPTTYSADLRSALAEYVGVRPSEVVVGCGSDELIDCALRALVAPGGRVAYCDPTFVMARIFALANSLEPVAIPFPEAFALDVDALVAAEPDLVYLCSPNNPTASLFDWEQLHELLERFDGPILLDEAYAEYVDDPFTPRAPATGRVISLRTMSKAWGLAGLRVGYAVGCREMIDALERVRGPFKLTAPSERAALAALQHDLGWMLDGVRRTRTARASFTHALSSLGFRPLPSHANFLLVPVPDAPALAATLLEHEVAVRPFSTLPGIGDAVRITVGADDAIERVVDVMARYRR